MSFFVDFEFTDKNRIIYGIDGEPIVWVSEVYRDEDTGELFAALDGDNNAFRIVNAAYIYEFARNDEVTE